MTSKLDRCYFDVVSAGTGSFVFAETVAGYLSPLVGADDGASYYYIAEVLTGGVPTQWELGSGGWTAGTQTLSRSALASSNGGLAVDFTDPPKVRMGVPLAADWPVVRGVTGSGVDNTDPENPVISGTPGPTGATGATGGNGTNGTNGADGVVQTIVAGTNVTVDSSDPANPIVSASGGGGTSRIDVTLDHAVPFTVDLAYNVVHLTTDGFGLEHSVIIPDMPNGPEDAGAPLVLTFTLTDPGDNTPLSGSFDPGEYYNLFFDNQFLFLRWNGFAWQPWAGQAAAGPWAGPYVFYMADDGEPFWSQVTDLFSVTVDPWNALMANLNGQTGFRQRQPNDIKTYTNLLSSGDPNLDTNVYCSKLIMDAGIDVVFSVTNGIISGHRHVIRCENLTVPGSTVTMDLTLITDYSDGVPASIVFTAIGQELLMEWQLWRDSNNGKWVIIGATAGVVTM